MHNFVLPVVTWFQTIGSFRNAFHFQVVESIEEHIQCPVNKIKVFSMAKVLYLFYIIHTGIVKRLCILANLLNSIGPTVFCNQPTFLIINNFK